ncbi:nitrate ABC transporter substrate-binding protein [Agarivorans sp. OAG1]|uniref:Thiamine pyrimidine synthase n=1 Tax=Agarivorans albus MKT 106 TaxID=1331007 RepID=R9PKG0_AGAAL|nr:MULTISPECIES: ABC transporter substrate-binding protein [Agarivorans]MPW30619.1 ABC transporter substrate-binding protein [Agarivorans sp. B2Z047]UQN42158.1 ABC transporter substrate-binding protein [Agarivorans sp. B2Z047]BEU01975.1 nitrate ABC transporter substrate-binding protein [Agarivorans sp. OAG1]GAD01849.1 substrate-binding component [Agarivorans albus MKT 106]
MNKKLISLASGAALLAASFGTSAAEKLTLQLKWVTQAQFAGYYVALNKGFYQDQGIDLTIKPGGPDIAPAQVLAGGGADVVVDWLPSALATREKGLPLVNIGQIYGKSGMMLTCLKSSGISSPADFKGKTLGVWFFGNEYPFLSWMSKLGYDTTGGEDGVTVLKQGFNVDPIFQGQADCVSTMTYNEYGQVLDGGLSNEELMLFKYEEEGVATLEDGLYVLEDSLKDSKKLATYAKFLKATIQGWEWAAANPKEAGLIVLDYDDTGAQTEEHQIRMANEVAKLLASSDKGIGYLDPAAFDRTVNVLLDSDSTPVITKKPEGAYTHAVFEAAAKL